MNRLANFVALLLCILLGTSPFSEAQETDGGAAKGVGAAGTIEGVVTFDGVPPRSSVPDDAGVRREIIQVDSNTKGLAHVVVYLTQTNGAAMAIAPSNLTNRAAAKPVMDQQNHEFTPRVLAVRAGEPGVFRNSDPANHNVRTTATVPRNEFNVFTGIDGKYEHRFVIEPENRPVRLGCDIHPWMRGWLYVFDHPWFAVTDERGRFQLFQVPPGEYLLRVVQPDLKHRESRRVVVAAGETRAMEITIRLEKPGQL